MKFSATLFVAAALAPLALASPYPNANVIAEPVDMVKRDTCYYPSGCSRNWSGKCEAHCESKSEKFIFMNTCFWGWKQCCCTYTP